MSIYIITILFGLPAKFPKKRGIFLPIFAGRRGPILQKSAGGEVHEPKGDSLEKLEGRFLRKNEDSLERRSFLGHSVDG